MPTRPIVFAAVLSGAAALGTGHVYMSRLESEVTGGERVRVLAARRDLPRGSVLSKDDLAVFEVPEAYLGRRQVRAPDSAKLLGATTHAVLKAGDVIQWSDLVDGRADDGTLADAVQKGMRALSISSDNLFDGLLQPGDRVDLLFTRHGGSETGTLLQNLLVLAINGSFKASESQAGGASRGSVVLGVTMEQAQTILHSEQSGQLRLSLRNPDDIKQVAGLPAVSSEGANMQASQVQAPLKPAIIERIR